MPVKFSRSKNTIHRITMQSKHGTSVSNRANDNRRRTCCGLSRIKTLKVLGTFLVPLVIGIFTIATTIQQYEINKQNRLKDWEIAARQRAQELKQADILQQETVYAVYVKEMGELLSKLKTKNVSNTELDQQWKLARAKTLSALRQLDTKRKSYIIQFLYETELLFTNSSAIDLSGSDLSGIILTDHVGMAFMFDYITLTYVVLSNTSFVNLHLMKADFSGSLLNNANFSNAYLFQVNFTECDLTNADLRGVHAEFAIMKNVNLSGAVFGKVPPVEIKNAILPNGSYVFYSKDHLQSDLFNESTNLITNGDANCQTNKNSTEIFGWVVRHEPVAIVTKYSELPSLITGNISIDDCVFWGGTRNNSIGYLHQRVFFFDYSRLIDSGRALYEFSFDTGGINEYNDYVYLTMQFRAASGQSLRSTGFPPITNIQRKNRSILCYQLLYGPVPLGTHSVLINIWFDKTSDSPFNNARLTRDIANYFIKRGQMLLNSEVDMPKEALICFKHAQKLEIVANERDKMKPNLKHPEKNYAQPDFRDHLDLLEGDNGLISKAEEAIHPFTFICSMTDQQMKRVGTVYNKLKNWAASSDSTSKFRVETASVENITFTSPSTLTSAGAASNTGTVWGSIIGLIYPSTAPFQQRGLRVEIRVPSTFPHEPPEIFMRTKIRHPNIEKDGK
ncbi:unnamed protein product [Rotaria sp. Silwood1]|nr:unnamed protein product [Rotaria sp. Silwood1]CAF4800855.1 unnamed protein product [Rotaria sp. Silwood1]